MLAGSTHFADLSPWTARALLLLFLLLLGWGTWLFLGRPETIPKPAAARSDEESDLALHRAILRRVHGGEDYYAAAQEELRRRSFPSRSPFNYRLPLLAWALRVFPDPSWGTGVLVILAVISLRLWARVLRQEGASVPRMIAGGLLLCGALALCTLPEGAAFPELWSGVLIGLSLAAHARGQTTAAVLLGTAALLIRELALPYVLVMVFIAWREGRRRETVGWMFGLASFALFLALHVYQVQSRMTDLDRPGDPWLQGGGWPFVIATARWNAYLLLTPEWLTVLVAPCALLGLAGWRGPVGTRAALTVGAYVCSFLIVGRPDNNYWGMMYGPLLPLGLIVTGPGLRDLWQAACRSRLPGGTA